VKQLFFVLALMLSTAKVSSAQCKDAVSTKDMQDCANTQAKQSDAELNRVYVETTKKSKTPESVGFRRLAVAPI
jgi:uncharacterized protein YecT (DUF1311 family)